MEAVAAILDSDPELGEGLDPEQFALARRHVRAQVLHYPVGLWEVKPDDFDYAATLGLLVLSGVLTREVTVGDYTCAELLGPGDLTQPWLRVGPDQSVATDVDFEVVEPLRVAVLDRGFLVRASRWPEITASVARRLMQRTHWLAFHLAICGLRRVDERLLLVLWHFADRWGVVTPEGVRLDLRLTHDVLASVVGARRPSVTTGLKRLVEQGSIAPRPKSRWLLLGEAPAELQQLHGTGGR